jgi:uncharacterized protein with GYD domain
MTIYISQGRYTAAAIKGMTAKPEDRSEAVAELFAAAGARLISWYLTLGPYDWLIIAEAPDEPTMISAVLAAAAGGSLSDITTTVALTASDTAKAFQRAGELTLKFRSAGRADYYGVGIDSGREMTVAMPAWIAARTFSFTPPIGSTRPHSEISPVIAVSLRIVRPVISDVNAMNIATPALGPSFGRSGRNMNADVGLLQFDGIESGNEGGAADPDCPAAKRTPAPEEGRGSFFTNSRNQTCQDDSGD